MNVELANISKQIKILNMHDWFTTSDQCAKCTFLSDAFKAKDGLVKLDNDLEVVLNKIEDIELYLKENCDSIENSEKLLLSTFAEGFGMCIVAVARHDLIMPALYNKVYGSHRE